MSSRKQLAILVLLALLLGGVPAAAGADPRAGAWAKVDTRVRDALAYAGRSEFLVVLREQADVSGAAALAGKAERGAYVYRTLKEVAERTQGDLRAYLDGQRIPYRAYYIRNLIWVQSAGTEAVLALAQRPEVDHIEANPWVHGLETPRPVPAAGSPEAVEWNISLVQAPQVWALGYHGEGAVVAGNDTGIQWDHPALVGHYRPQYPGYGRHDFNWHDAISNLQVPYDGYGHGTHTVGTMIGDDGGSNQIGMAPGAYWIGCKNMSDAGVGSPATYIECFEFLLAPYPWNNPGAADPSRAPDVINNSWGCPTGEGCSPETLEPAVQALRSAGIEVVVSAGNSGAGGCGTLYDPPSFYQQSFSVGATTASDLAASYSSRGPVTYGGDTYVKPNIAAPGSSVRSAFPTNAYRSMSGTSMAAPHVAGLVALLISACPGLAGAPAALEQIITSTAVVRLDSQCGEAGPPNNVYGWGRIDALAAVQAALAQCVAPVASFEHSVPACQGAAVAFTNTSDLGLPPAEDFLWTLGDGITSTLKDPSHLYGAAGAYTVTLEVCNLAGCDTAAEVVVVAAAPQAAYSFTVSELTVTFTNKSSGAAAYLWGFGDGGTSTQTHPVHTYAAAGTYSVALTATGECGSALHAGPVSVRTLPEAGFLVSAPVCLSQPAVFTDTSAGAESYLWSFGDGVTATVASPVHSYAAAGPYTVTQEVCNALGCDTAAAAVAVVPGPEAAFGFVADLLTVTFTNASHDATAYLWSFGDGITATVVHPVHAYAAAGTYAVTLTAAGPCGLDVVSHPVTVSAPPARWRIYLPVVVRTAAP